jgi:hypothetical protein
MGMVDSLIDAGIIEPERAVLFVKSMGLSLSRL